MKTPTIKDLECLACWPAGTVGEANEMRAIRTLLQLCNDQGFGRIPQLAAQIEEIWHNPEAIAEYQKSKSDHLALLSEAIASRKR